ncbi:OmpA family protein [Desulfoplanes sp.]
MQKKLLALVFAGMFLIYGGLGSASAMDLVPKVDNFIFLVDSSGSMGWDYKESGKTKIVLAKEILSQLNRHIPELGYVSSLDTLAPLKTYAEPAVYNTMAYGRAIDTIPTDILTWGFMGNPTPLGEGITAMDSIIGCMPGSKALILISDGGNNSGGDPVKAAQRLYEKHHPNLCIHVISLADTEKGQKLLDDIASLSSCSVNTTLDRLQDQNERAGFIQEVFYGIAPDSDQDGVADINDECPATPMGVAVDDKGCPFDSDGDGVYDYLDECPDTPAGVQIDQVGCPLDTDGDGVSDYLDACPGTPADFVVDAKGCPQPISIDLGLEFDLNRADIKQKYHHKLEEVALFLIHHPGVTAVVEGHTDSQGAASYNKKLSQKRAQSVVDYLTKKFGVDPSMITSQGYGEETPIADNATPEGRQKNRRVLVVISGAYQTR